MKVIIINDYGFINGGAAKVAIDSAIGLVKQGFQVVFLCAVGPVAPELLGSDVKVICIGQTDILNDSNRLRAAVNGLWNVLAMRKMADLLLHYSPSDTIVHVHGWTKALSSSPIRIAIRRGFKVILTLHDYFVACPNGGFFDYPAKRICKRRPLSFSCVMRNCDVRSYPQKIWRVIRQIVQKDIGRIPFGISGFIAVSNFSLGILRKNLPSTNSIRVISNPIETNRAKPVNVASNQNFVCASRLSEEKGVGLFAEAMKQLGYGGIVVGDGPLANKLRMQYPDMIYTGWQSANDLLKILQQARVLIFPSLWYEVQPLIVLEAMSLGIPVIVPDTSAAREIITDGVTGLWFQGGDLGDLINKIRQCQNDPVLVANLGLAAHQAFWSNPPTIKSHILKLIQMYKSILEPAPCINN